MADNTTFINPLDVYLSKVAGDSPQSLSTAQNQVPVNFYATSKYFNPSDPFAAGRALTNQYKDIYNQETGTDLMDLSRYGGRYAQELSTPGGRARFADDLNLVDLNTGDVGYYKTNDLAPLVGLENLNDPYVIKNYASLFDQGNSYFIPDFVEVDPYQYAYHAGPGENLSKEDQEALFDRMYHGRMLANNAAFGAGAISEGTANPEAVIRDLMRSEERFGKGPDYYNRELLDAAGVLAAFDVGRGDLTFEQGDALSRALEAQKNYDSLKRSVEGHERNIARMQDELANLQVKGGNTATYDAQKESLLGQIASVQNTLDFQRRGLDTYKSSLDPYLQTLSVIEDPTRLSSADIFAALRPPKGAHGGFVKKSPLQLIKKKK